MARLKKEHRAKQILLAALELSRDKGLESYTLADVADFIGCSHGTVLHHYGSAINLRDHVIQEAIRMKDLRVVGEAVFKHYSAAAGLDARFASQAVNVFVGRQLHA